jgi:hypothetical protein
VTEDFAPFARLIDALRPWLPRLVVVGGWAHRLHRFHPLANPPHHPPIRTLDADFAFSNASALDGDVLAALRRAGFSEELFGDDAPPVTQYSLGRENAGFYAEFLTPLRGDGIKSNGAPDATVATAGITAQKLRYLELLLISPWSVRLAQNGSVPVASDVEVFVPSATSFIVQRLLIHSDRSRAKKAQDVLYIHDTLELFGGALDSLHQTWLESVRPAMPEKTGRRAATIAATLFGELTDTIRDAARIPQDRRLAPEQIRAACEYGLREILG